MGLNGNFSSRVQGTSPPRARQKSALEVPPAALPLPPEFLSIMGGELIKLSMIIGLPMIIDSSMIYLIIVGM